MTAHDAILHLVHMLMQEKDKNVQLQLQLQQPNQMKEKQQTKANK